MDDRHPAARQAHAEFAGDPIGTAGGQDQSQGDGPGQRHVDLDPGPDSRSAVGDTGAVTDRVVATARATIPAR
jgi:hypothetical protein